MKLTTYERGISLDNWFLIHAAAVRRSFASRGAIAPTVSGELPNGGHAIAPADGTVEEARVLLSCLASAGATRAVYVSVEHYGGEEDVVLFCYRAPTKHAQLQAIGCLLAPIVRVPGVVPSLGDWELIPAKGGEE